MRDGMNDGPEPTVQRTNKQERFLVMSEAEFERAMSAAELVGTGPEFMRKTLIETREIAEAACRVRPVKPLYNFHGEITQWVDEND